MFVIQEVVDYWFYSNFIRFKIDADVSVIEF